MESRLPLANLFHLVFLYFAVGTLFGAGITSLSVDALGTRLAVAYCSNEIVIYDGHLHDPDRLQGEEIEARKKVLSPALLKARPSFLRCPKNSLHTRV